MNPKSMPRHDLHKKLELANLSVGTKDAAKKKMREAERKKSKDESGRTNDKLLRDFR